MSLRESVDELNKMISAFRIMEAFDKFYADDVVMRENNEEPRAGKSLNRELEQQGLEQIEKWHYAEIKAVAVNEEDQIAMTEWEMSRALKGGGNTKHNQVAVQQWKDGKIIHERFYYNLSEL